MFFFSIYTVFNFYADQFTTLTLVTLFSVPKKYCLQKFNYYISGLISFSRKNFDLKLLLYKD